MISQMDSRPSCQCGSGECQPKILHSILSYKYSTAGLTMDSKDPDEKQCQRSVYSPSGSTGSCYNSPGYSPASSPNPAAAPASSSPSPPSNSKLFLLLNGQRPVSKSPAPHTGAALAQYPRVVPSPGAASTCSSGASDGYLYQSSQHELDQEQPLNLKRSFHQSYSSSTTTATALSEEGFSADQPMDLSCKKRRLSTSSTCSVESGLSAYIKRETASPYENSGLAVNDCNDSILKSILCGQHRRPSRVASPSHYSLPPSPLSQQSTASQKDSNSSNILSGILHQNRFGMVTGDSQPGSRCSTPGSTGAPSLSGSQSSIHLLSKNKHTVVALAKKNLFPVTARVSDWLVKIVHFAKSQPEFTNLPHTDQVSLILHSWARILLLFMAETSFEFAVTPKTTTGDQPSPSDDETKIPDSNTPTMRHVDTIQRFISKCQSLGLDQQEYSYLKMITLFNQGMLQHNLLTYRLTVCGNSFH